MRTTIVALVAACVPVSGLLASIVTSPTSMNPVAGPVNTPRFDRNGLTTHVRFETADPNPFVFGPRFPHKLLELHEYRHRGVAGESQDDQ